MAANIKVIVIFGILVLVGLLLSGHLDFGGNFQFQAVNSAVTFRTNAFDDEYIFNAHFLQVAVDYNGDGSLECFKYSSYYQAYFVSSPTTLVLTPGGYKVNKYGSTDIIVQKSPNIIFTPATASECTISLSTSPTEPYTSENQETYGAGTCAPNCNLKCGGASDGCSGTCNSCPSGYTCSGQVCISSGGYSYSCIDNVMQNNKIDKQELLNVLQAWIEGR